MKTLRLWAAAPVAAFFLIISASAADSPAVAATPGAASAAATDPSGNWTWSITLPNSDQSFESTAKLDFKDGKLTGTVTGRMGPAPISDASVKDGTIAFTIVRERDDQKFVIKYAGKLAGDAITGTIDFPAFGGGDPMKFDWNATRVK